MSAPYVCTLERIPAEARCLLKFQLIYDGELPADQRGRGLSGVKSKIRREFSPQLEELWRTHKDLKILMESGNSEQIDLRDGFAHAWGAPAIARDYSVGEFMFVPLVRRTNQMLCRLDISVMLRQPPYHTTFMSGDLDNRIKTLIDGLRMPRQVSEHDGAPGETLFCLMDNDDRISEFSVRCDQLLAPKRPDQTVRDAVAVISVEVLNTTGHVLTTGGSPFALEKEQ